MIYCQYMNLPPLHGLPRLGYGFKVTGIDSAGAEQIGYCIIGSKEARGSIKTNIHHVEAAARLSARLRFHEWGNHNTTRVNVISAWFRSSRS